MTSIKRFIARFAKFDCGSVAIEYGLLAGLVSVAIIAGSTSAGTSLNTLLAGTADLGRALWLHHGLIKSAETAGRFLARTADPADAGNQAAAAAMTSGASFAVTASGDATLVTTTATAVFTPLTGLLFGNGLTMQVSHVERWLGQ